MVGRHVDLDQRGNRLAEAHPLQALKLIHGAVKTSGIL
jgi:hypothetical protein